MPNDNCQHRGWYCTPVIPGMQRCTCGQLFVFVQVGNCVGRYKKVEELTEADRQAFTPEVEREFLRFIKKE